MTNGCAHVGRDLCSHAIQYELLEDGTITKGEVILGGDGIISHPYRSYRPSDPQYAAILIEATLADLNFSATRRGGATHYDPC
jgi:hypothetical protein